MMITCNKQEFISNGYNLKVQNAILTDSTNPEENSSGIVILMMTVLPKDDKHFEIVKWNRDMLRVI